MKFLGLELSASELRCALLDSNSNRIERYTKLSLTSTRSAADVRAFHTALAAVLTDLKPDLIAIKQKPESGQMRAGAAALKIEALVLLSSTVEVVFVTPHQIAKAQLPSGSFPKHLQGAALSASAVAK